MREGQPSERNIGYPEFLEFVIITNGDKFRIMYKEGRKLKYLGFGSRLGSHLLKDFRSEAEAREYIKEHYGTQAIIKPKEWRPI